MCANDSERIKQQQRIWEQEIVSLVTARWPERREVFRNTSDIDIRRIYTPST